MAARLWHTHFRSRLAATPHGMTKRFGPFIFLPGLRTENGVLHYPVDARRLGPLPLPRWVLPVSEAPEFVKDGRFQFDVKLRAPLTGDVLVHCQDGLTPATMDTGRTGLPT